MPASTSSPVPPALEQLGALYADLGSELLTCLESVPDRRGRSGRRYPLELSSVITPFHLPHAATAIRVIRTRTVKGKTSRETVYYATDLRVGPDLTPVALAYAIGRHWAIESSSHHVSDRTFTEDACTTRTGTAPQALAAVRNLAIGLLHCVDEPNIARALRRYNRDEPATLQLLGITPQQT